MYQFLSRYTSLFKNFWLMPCKNDRCLPAPSNKNMGMYWINSILQMNFSFHAISFLVKNYFKSIFLQKRFPVIPHFQKYLSIFLQNVSPVFVCVPVQWFICIFKQCFAYLRFFTPWKSYSLKTNMNTSNKYQFQCYLCFDVCYIYVCYNLIQCCRNPYVNSSGAIKNPHMTLCSFCFLTTKSWLISKKKYLKAIF